MRSTEQPEAQRALGAPIRKPADKPQRVDEQVAPGVFKDGEGRMYTKIDTPAPKSIWEIFGIPVVPQ